LHDVPYSSFDVVVTKEDCMKQCRNCGLLKEDDEFWAKRKNGRRVLRATCKVCYKLRIAAQPSDDYPHGRTCTTCGECKPLESFHKHAICLYGREPICKVCKANKRRLRDAANPERARSVDLKAKYGITLEEYEAMSKRQDGRCAICGTSQAKLVVDHHHTTRRVRSLLCHLCNAMIGCAREDAEILANGIRYLQQHGAQQAAITSG
jgi:hypothetical protein